MRLLGSHRCFEGEQRFFRYSSEVVGLPMKFGLYLPPQASAGPVPLLVFLAGLTCTEETFAIKAGAQRFCAQHGLALLTPDTSPRDAKIAGEDADWDFGLAAGFYLDATQAPWSAHWRMESWLLDELLPLVGREQGVDVERCGIFGHSMGGHGALTLALRHPGRFKSVSAFAPIVSPTQVPWGQKAFKGYLGDDEATWAQHDASILMARQTRVPYPQGILIDQGLRDPFLTKQLLPENFEAACSEAGQPLTLRRHAGYDHNYFFIQTFVADHVEHHAKALR